MENTTAAVAERPTSPDWYALMDSAIREPGELSQAHKHFRQYSLTNRWLASTQLRGAGLPLMPINTFKGWLNTNRAVMKGQKASIALIMPVPIKGKKKGEDADSDEKSVVFTKFMLRSFWFHLGQTDGEEYVPDEANGAEWSLESAKEFFNIEERPFEFMGLNDMRQGVAMGSVISISPLASDQKYARLREMSRIVLGHTADTPAKSVPTDQGFRDMEAEATAYLCAATLGLTGMDESRALLQAGLASTAMNRIPDRCVHRAFSAADKLINAGFC